MTLEGLIVWAIALLVLVVVLEFILMVWIHKAHLEMVKTQNLIKLVVSSISTRQTQLRRFKVSDPIPTREKVREQRHVSRAADPVTHADQTPTRVGTVKRRMAGGTPKPRDPEGS